MQLYTANDNRYASRSCCGPLFDLGPAFLREVFIRQYILVSTPRTRFRDCRSRSYNIEGPNFLLTGRSGKTGSAVTFVTSTVSTYWLSKLSILRGKLGPTNHRRASWHSVAGAMAVLSVPERLN